MTIEKEYCRGGCGKLAIYGHWCCKKYNKCPGYRKTLSDKAKKRGNYDIHKKFRQFTKEELAKRSKKKLFHFICSQCEKPFDLEITTWATEHPSFVPYCDSCKSERRSEAYKRAWKRRRESAPYEDLTVKYRKEIIWREQGEKCSICGYDLYPLEEGPYQLHHKDGDSSNHSKENEEILCANCHQLTDTWGGKGREWTEQQRIRHRETHLDWFNRTNCKLKY